MRTYLQVRGARVEQITGEVVGEQPATWAACTGDPVDPAGESRPVR